MVMQQILLVNDKVVDGQSLRYVHGTPYAHLTRVFSALGGTTLWQAKENQAVVTWRGNLLIVPAVGQSMILNGERRAVSHKSQVYEGRLYVALASLAEVFGGVLSSKEDTLELYIPIGHLSALLIGEDSMTLQWTGNNAVEELVQRGSFKLQGTSWPVGLNGLTIQKDSHGDLLVEVDVVGSIEHQVAERFLRLSWESSGKPLEEVVVAVDAGHGGQQPGAVSSSGKLEKDQTRAVADRLCSLLAANGATVLDVRPNDETVSLSERVSRARQGGAKVFISIHYNAYNKQEANGTETFYAIGNQSAARLASLIQAELVLSLRLRDRGIKQASFYVLQALPDIPSVLVEVGFITNPVEEAHLLKDSTIELTAQAILRGLLAFYDEQK